MDDIIATSRKYWRSAGRKGLAHYHAAEMFAKRHRRIGIPSVIMSTVVATSVFSTLSENVDVRLRIATGVVALLAAILAALQAFLAFGERAEKHRAAGARYGKVRRDIDIFDLKFSSAGVDSRENALKRLQTITDELSTLATENPTLGDAIYAKAKKDFDSTQPEE
jgi:hypothetical protein